MRSTFHSFICGILASCLLCSFNAHLPVLQVAAWAGMIVKFAAEEDIVSAVRDTFDGEHPCKMCRVVEAETTRARASLQAAPVMKTDPLPLQTMAGFLPPASARVAFHASPESGEVLAFPPDVPPPQARG